MRYIYPNNADRSIRMCGIGTPIWDRSIAIIYGIDLYQ